MRRKDWDDPAAQLTQYYGSSEAFRDQLRMHHPDLMVPERSIVYLGESIPCWSPDREAPHPAESECSREDFLRSSSLLCCPHCHRSGFDGKLAKQRQLAGYIPAEPPPPKRQATSAKPKTPAKETRRERRRRVFGCRLPARSQSAPTLPLLPVMA